MEITIRIDNRSKQANAVLEMLKTFDFVRFVDNNDQKAQSAKKVKSTSEEINKTEIKKSFSELDLDDGKEQFLNSISKKVNRGMAEKWYEKSGIAY